MLARALILRLGAMDTAAPPDDRLRHLAQVMLDELEALAESPFNLAGGTDPRLTRLTRHLIANPGDQRPLTALAALAGASPRTLERLFRAETGLPFLQWRSRLRLLCAIEALNRGESSTTIAWSLGWRSPPAFVAAFRDQFGVPPQRFLQADRGA